jgi:hypothetical protein
VNTCVFHNATASKNPRLVAPYARSGSHGLISLHMRQPMPGLCAGADTGAGRW